MRSKFVSFLLAFVSLPSAWPSAASESLTLDRAFEEARAHSSEYLRAQAVADEASARAFEAFSGYLPRVTVGGSYLTNHLFLLFPFGAATIEAPNPITSLAGDVTLNLFDGFQTTNTYRAAWLQDEAAQHDANYASLQLESSVKLKFYQALSAQLLAAVADQNVKTLQDHLAKTRALLSGGATTKLDTLRVDVQLSEALPDQIQANDNVVVTRKALAQAMGLDEDNRPLTGTLPVPDASKLPADLKLELSRRDDLLAAQERADAAAKARLATHSAYIPRVNLAGEYMVYNNINGTLDTTLFHNAYTLGFYLSWSIFDAASVARSREASAQREQSEMTAQAALQRAPVDFETWKRRFLANVALYQARTHAIESATESVRLARISYEAGTRTSTEVLDAELDLFRARAGVVRAQVDSAEALINLELAVGHHL